MSIGRVFIHQHTLDQPFVAEGQFWLPETPEQRVAGTLNYSPGSITVNLIGDPGAIGSQTLLRDDGGVRELVLGSTRVGPCALWSAFSASSSTTYGVGGTIGVATYRANRLCVGEAYESVDEIEFKDFVISFDVLPTWLGHNPFGPTEPDSDALHRYVPFTPVAAVIPEEDLQIELSTRLVDRGGGYQGFTWVHEVWFAIRSPEPKDIEWHLEKMGRVQAFLSTLVEDAAIPTSIVGSLDPLTLTYVILPLTRAPAAEAVSEIQILLPYGEIGDRFTDSLCRWIREWKHIGTAATLLYGTLLVELPPEFELLALTQALETFHRHVYDGTYLGREEYEKVQAALAGALPSGTPSDLRQALTRRIEYGHEYSQRKRFHELLASLDDTARDLVRTDRALLNRVVDERNHLTHRPPESNDYVPMDNAERRLTAQKLKAFLFLLLLSHLHFTGEDVKGATPCPGGVGQPGQEHIHLRRNRASVNDRRLTSASEPFRSQNTQRCEMPFLGAKGSASAFPATLRNSEGADGVVPPSSLVCPLSARSDGVPRPPLYASQRFWAQLQRLSDLRSPRAQSPSWP